MKRTLCLLLALFLIGITAFAEIPDISGLTDEELLDLDSQVGKMIMDRGLQQGTRLPIGVFTVGSDIAPGRYIIHITSNHSGNGHLYVYLDEASYRNDERDVDHFIGSSDVADYYIVLNEGNIFDFNLDGLNLISKAETIG